MKKKEEFPPYLEQHPNGDYQFGISRKHIQILKEKNLIPEELANNFLEQIQKCNEEYLESKNKTPDEIIQTMKMRKRTILDLKKDIGITKAFQDFVVKNWDSIVEELIGNTKPTGLFKNVITEQYFGMSQVVADPMYHLERLLSSAELTHIVNNSYEVIGESTNSDQKIELIYEIEASSDHEAEKIADEYKKTMRTGGLKTFLSYWKIASDMKKAEYSIPLIESMKRISDTERKSVYSVKEKQNHWEKTKMLRRVRLKVSKKTKKRGRFREQFIEMPLLEILGGEKDEQEKYPEIVMVRVLPNLPNKKMFAPRIFDNNTLYTHPEATLFTFTSQIRASQRKDKEIFFDWDYTFRLMNLEASALKNKSAAKAKVRKKLNKDKTIESWTENQTGIIVKTKKST